MTINDAIEILVHAHIRSVPHDPQVKEALDAIALAFDGAEKKFFCPECGGGHFGSAKKADDWTRSCHSCRKVPHFSWHQKDDHKYFRWVITLPMDMLKNDLPKIVGQIVKENDDVV